MKYVKSFNILGIDTAQTSCIELQGVPNSATEGAVGLLGVNMLSDEHEVYLCTAVNGSVYTWQCLKDGKDGACVVKTEINDIGELIITLSDGKIFNAGVVKGKDGVDGINGANGIDGAEISNVVISDKNELIFEMSNGKVINAGTLPTVKGDAGVSVVKAEFNNAGEMVLTLSSGELLTVGHVIPTLQDWLGTNPIGSDTHYIYYDGEKFIERPVSIKDETTEWAQIASMADKISKGEKTPEQCGLAVGDKFAITLTTGEEVTFVILDFNYDDLEDGSGKAGITFGMENLLATKYPLSVTGYQEYYTSSKGGMGGTPWEESYLRCYLMDDLYNKMPEDLKSFIKSVSKITASTYFTAGMSSNELVKYFRTKDRLFLLSADEFGYVEDSADQNSIYESDYGRKGAYDYYKNQGTSLANKRVKSLNDGYGASTSWCTRTPWYKTDGTYSTGYCFNNLGEPISARSGDIGICFCFCI